MASGSKVSIYGAIAANLLIAVSKFIASFFTGSWPYAKNRTKCSVRIKLFHSKNRTKFPVMFLIHSITKGYAYS